MQNPHHFLHVGRHVTCDTWLPCRYARQDSPGTPSPPLTREKVRPARPLQRCFREKTRPARHKTPIVGHFSCAGRTFSRTGSCDVATLKPTTPLQPLMQANVKPPSPMLAPEQQPLKPPSPLRPINAPKTAISHPQRRRRFQSHTRTSGQRRWRFHARDLRCPRAMAGPGRSSIRRTEPHISVQAPPVWRAPEGPEGTGGLRDRPLRAFRLACGDLAGGRARRRPEHQRSRKQQAQSRIPAAAAVGGGGAWPGFETTRRATYQ